MPVPHQSHYRQTLDSDLSHKLPPTLVLAHQTLEQDTNAIDPLDQLRLLRSLRPPLEKAEKDFRWCLTYINYYVLAAHLAHKALSYGLSLTINGYQV